MDRVFVEVGSADRRVAAHAGGAHLSEGNLLQAGDSGHGLMIAPIRTGVKPLLLEERA